ncbi:MAG: histidine kinase [Proteobacteria bacterium]|nr:histidine kinase [Pseudomonadota bacterium]
MIFKRFTMLLAFRVMLVGLSITVTVWLVLRPGYYSVTILSAATLLMFSAELWWFISRTNREIARFLDAARHADFSQRFSFGDVGTGFDELGAAFTDILANVRGEREDQEIEVRQLRALIEHIPVPLLTLHGDQSISLQNNAARRLFGAAHVTRLKDLRQFGLGFHDALAAAVPGNRELVTFSVEGIEYQLTLATTEVFVAGMSDRLISLQDIQTELDLTQAQAWQDIVRVLTHEIMNSMTPVTSLATTASDVIDDVIDKTASDSPIAADLADLRDAISTVARRSDSLMQFVDSYRQLTRLAPPEKKRVLVAELFESVARLAAAEWPDRRIALTQQVDPAGLDVFADRDLLEPVLLNLLRNAWHATLEVSEAKIDLRASLNRRGNIVIEVSDNGPGVANDIASKIFVPFFTTKEGGSGVGLALARQVMTAHGGFIRVMANDGGGAKFSLTF